MYITDKQLDGWIKIMITSEQLFRELWLNDDIFIGLQEVDTWHAVNSHFIELTPTKRLTYHKIYPSN